MGETWDGFLNDINGFHVKAGARARGARRGLATARSTEGAVGGGTGMVCHGFKGGIGTSSRVAQDGWMVGVLVQANHGQRSRLRVNGVPVGEKIGPDVVPLPGTPEGAGSIIVLIATDAPLLPHPVRTARPPRRLRNRAHRRHGRALERRLRALLRDRKPGARDATKARSRSGC